MISLLLLGLQITLIDSNTSNIAELRSYQEKVAKLQAFDSSYFRGKSHSEDDGTRNYVVFQSIQRYFKMVANTSKVTLWKSKGLSDESIKPPLMSMIVLIQE